MDAKNIAILMLINLNIILIFAYKYFLIQTITLLIYESTDLSGIIKPSMEQGVLYVRKPGGGCFSEI
jgi:hypothetical protein